MSPSETDRERFAEIFLEQSPRVFAFARRRCDAATAHDVTAETFLVAWRRLDQLPEQPLPWLLGTARNVLRNQARGAVRRDRLVRALTPSSADATSGPAADDAALERARLAEALTRLTEREREALLLIAWDGLTSAQAAEVTGCSANAFARRLSRARARLHDALTDPSPDPSPSPTAPRPTSLHPSERHAR